MKTNFIGWMPVMNTNYVPSRKTNWNIWRTGWAPIYESRVMPAIEWMRAGGFQPRWQWHWPHGRDVEQGESLQDFDSWVEATEQGQHGLVDDYIEQGQRLRDDGIELITYFDSLRTDTDFRRLVDQSQPYGTYDYMSLFTRSVEAGLACGSLGFDNVTAMYSDDPAMVIGPGHLGYDLLSAVRHGLEREGNGARCYVEATPRNNAPWWHDWNLLIVNKTFRSRHIEPLHPGLATKKDWWPVYRDGVWVELDATGMVVKEGVYTGEIIRLCARPEHFLGKEVTHDSIIATYKQIVGDGHTMAMRTDLAIEAGVLAAELVP